MSDVVFLVVSAGSSVTISTESLAVSAGGGGGGGGDVVMLVFSLATCSSWS